MIEMVGTRRKHHANFSVNIYNILNMKMKHMTQIMLIILKKKLYGLLMPLTFWGDKYKEYIFYIKQVKNITFKVKEPYYLLLNQDLNTHIVISKNIYTLKIYQLLHDNRKR